MGAPLGDQDPWSSPHWSGVRLRRVAGPSHRLAPFPELAPMIPLPVAVRQHRGALAALVGGGGMLRSGVVSEAPFALSSSLAPGTP